MNDAIPPVQGLVAGKYEILGLIGRGGMGSVWEGRHTSLGTRVAVKFIDPEYAESQEACARFVTEARAAATIQSKYAIQIFDHGVTEAGRPYIVMELLVGEPLDKRLERLGRLSLTETARIIGHVSRALQRAHDAGIIHRDLKPENIFLVRTPDDDDEIAKVLDFGIAKIKAPPGEQGISSSTKTGAVLGTPYYMSPEQARGLRNIDHRSDLWSLGVIAHKCVTGVLPFEGESVGDLLVKICTAPLPTPSVTVPGLTATFDAWFARALEREPARRFGRASELADGLNFAAGLSARGAASSHALSPVPVARTISASAISLPAAGVTSAPITTPSVQTKSSRGVLLGVVAAAVVGGAIGIAAVVKLAAGPRAAGAGSETAVLGASTAGSAGAVDPAFSARASSSLPPSSLPPSSAPPPSASAASPGAPSTPTAVVAAMQGSPGPKSTTATPWPAPRPKLTATPPALAPAPTLPPASPPTPAPRPAPPRPSPNQADPGY